MDLLPFVDVLKVFNNPINEEQAWAVCYQCAHFLHRNPSQEFYQDVYKSGIHSIWLSRHGDVLLRKGPADPNGSGKGPPEHGVIRPPHSLQSSPSSSATSTTTTTTSNSPTSRTTTTTQIHRDKSHVLATEADAVQALGTAIFEALDYGIDQSEERQLSPELESIIAAMTNTAVDSSLDYDIEGASNGDDEGIEKDADVEMTCTIQDVIKMCVRHLSSKQDASHHYKAVCRALATEAGELFTFLDKVAAGKEQLCNTKDEDARRLDELQRADWACLWVQVMRSLRQGVRLKKVEHVHLPPLEYELTPFEMILEDIRSRRYTLTKIMVNGDIPPKVKNDAHAVILNFIRSRPPLKKVDERKLKPKPPSPPDPHELLLREIRARPKLRPIREGRLVVEKNNALLRTPSSEEEPDRIGMHTSSTVGGTVSNRAPAKRVIKPDFNLLLNNSFEESSDDEDRSNNNSPRSPEYGNQYMNSRNRSHSQDQTKMQQRFPHLYQRSDSLTMTPPPQHTWQRAVTREALLGDAPNQQTQGRNRLQRRHTITLCEAPLVHQVAGQELPVLQELQEEEEEGGSPVKERASSGSSSNTNIKKISENALMQVQKAANNQELQSDKQLSKGQLVKSTATITLRQQPNNIVRRASFEHRRSLTSHGSIGLSAIPEQEDDGKPPAIMRAKSQEQCPPPNPSPPCKGRAKQGLAMVGMRPTGKPYHPCSTHHKIQLATTASSTKNTITTPQSVTASPLPSSSTTPSDSMQHAYLNSISFTSDNNTNIVSQHAPSVCSSIPYSRSYPSTIPTSCISSSSFSSQSAPVPMPRTQRSTSLDLGSSSQSPSYRRFDQNMSVSNNFNVEPTTNSTVLDNSSTRWRSMSQSHQSQTANITQNSYTQYNKDFNQGHANSSPSPARRWAVNSQQDNYSYHHNKPYDTQPNLQESKQQHAVSSDFGYYPVNMTEEEVKQKRMSLDTGMSMYFEEALRRDDEPDSLPSSPTLSGRNKGITRRTSVGLDRGVKSRAGFRRIKSPEEIERISRWRDLQEDDHQTRLRKQQPQDSMIQDSNLGRCSPALRQDYVEGYQTQSSHHRRSGVSTVNNAPLHSIPHPEGTDVLQQRMADEEARFERWRRLEEGTGSHPLLEHLDQHRECPSPTMSRSRKGQHKHHSSCSGRGSSLERSNSRNESLERAKSPFAFDSNPSTSQLHALSSSPVPGSGHELVHATVPLQKRWQNPVECLSLTLEEVTHIRSVLTKAELESLISHPDLYQQVSKSKLCFTCKTTRFALFGEWGTKCKFCKRTVCSKCLRKMNVPADHFKNIPVYTLSPTPLTQEMQDFIEDFVKGAPAASVPATRDHSPNRSEVSHPSTDSRSGKASVLSGSSKPLQRSQSALVTGQKTKSISMPSSSNISNAIKGPVMAICCDCKGMLMEVIRATRQSLTLISSPEGRASLISSSSSAVSDYSRTSLSPTPTHLASLNPQAKKYLATKSNVGSR